MWQGLEVGKAETEVPDDAVAAELDRLREGFASLAPVERAAAAGDAVVIDFAGTIDGEPFEGSESSDFVIELGAESLLAEFDAALTGAAAGDERTVEVSFPDDHQPAELAGKTASFAVTVKEVREKNLPELDDEFASEASEFETLDELRDAPALADGRGARAARRGRVPRGRGRRRRRQRDARDPPRPRPRPRPRDVGADRAPARPAWDRPAGLCADAGQGPPRADRRRGGGRGARAAPRGGARRGRGVRGDRGLPTTT